jgi:hypothetical protein
MPRPSFDREAIEAEIDRVKTGLHLGRCDESKPLFDRRHSTKWQQMARAGPAVSESLDEAVDREGPVRNDKLGDIRCRQSGIRSGRTARPCEPHHCNVLRACSSNIV